ncbi:MAG: hypothetical protein M1817_004451 [Caeruleum heppii]|nr:MAG: hypothetical protein M1817_004451 [Caeruleum heppii]
MASLTKIMSWVMILFLHASILVHSAVAFPGSPKLHVIKHSVHARTATAHGTDSLRQLGYRLLRDNLLVRSVMPKPRQQASPWDCQSKCGDDIVGCYSQCMGVTNADWDAANATTACTAQCAMYHSGPDNAECRKSCIVENYMGGDPDLGAPRTSPPTLAKRQITTSNASLSNATRGILTSVNVTMISTVAPSTITSIYETGIYTYPPLTSSDACISVIASTFGAPDPAASGFSSATPTTGRNGGSPRTTLASRAERVVESGPFDKVAPLMGGILAAFVVGML